MFRFAIKTLVFDRGKFLIALIGVFFSIVLVNVQTGLFLGLVKKGSVLIDNAKADIWVGHRGLENVEFANAIPVSWMQRVRGLSGVQDAEPLIMATATMSLASGAYETIWVVGFERSSNLIGAWSVSRGEARDLNQPDAITIEELEAWKLGEPKIGDVLEISGKRARIVAMTRGILTFTSTPYVFTNIDAGRAYTGMHEGYCSYILVKASPGTDIRALAQSIRQRIPEGDVYTAAEYSRKSRRFWIARTGMGFSFGGATVLGLIVGFVMVAQSLYAMTLDHIDDYAALKAIGADDQDIYAILIIQAMTIAIVGIALGMAVVYLVESMESPLAEIDLAPWLVLSGVALNVLTCVIASILPIMRISHVDPIVTLQG